MNYNVMCFYRSVQLVVTVKKVQDHACIQCPPGYSCINGTVITSPMPCPAGTYSFPGDDDCSSCPLTTYSEEAAEICIPCPQGHQCPTPSDTPEPCASGTYSPGSETFCLPCPGGVSCNGTATEYCPLGQYSLPGVDACIPCPQGTSCQDPGATPMSCGDGYYSGEGDPVCHACPAGYNCSSKVDSILCPQGYFSSYGEPGCSVCPPGRACPLTFLQPIACQPGQHTNGEIGRLICMECPAGYYCSDPRSVCLCVCLVFGRTLFN